MEGVLSKTEFSPGKLSGASPADDRFYLLILFDISEQKKYRLLIKILNNYCTRVQKSVFEGHLKMMQIKQMMTSIEKLMASTRFYNPDDNVRIYRISGNCTATVFGSCTLSIIEENIFF